MTEFEHPEYAWHDDAQTCAYAYLWPSVREEITRVAAGRPLKILDLGCGNGAMSARLAALGHSVMGVDVSASGVEIARSKFTHVRFEQASLYDTEIQSRIGGAFDCIVSLEVLEHLFFPRKLFEQSRRLLAPGGTLLLSTPYHGYLKNLALSLTNRWDSHFTVEWDGGHIKFFSKATLARMAREERFEVERIIGAGRVPGLWKAMILVARAPRD